MDWTYYVNLIRDILFIVLYINFWVINIHPFLFYNFKVIKTKNEL